MDTVTTVTIALWIAGGAGVLAVIIGIYKACTSSKSSCDDSSGSCCGDGSCDSQSAGVAMGASPNPRRRKNARGWNAPSSRYWFDDDGYMHDTDSGDLITDMLIIAELCGITDIIPGIGPDGQDYIPAEHTDGTEVVASVAIDEGENFEDIATQPETMEPIPSAPIPTPEPAPAPAPEPVYAPAPEPVVETTKDYGSGFGDSYGESSGGGYDSGGDCGGGGGD